MSATRSTAPARRNAVGAFWLETPIDGLYASPPQVLPFARSLEVRAFLLRRAPGNLLIYSVDGLESGESAIEPLGGIARQYLNHSHEAMFASERVGAPLFVHENERATVERAIHVRATFLRRHTLDDDFEVIPAPGHTAGATAFLWDNGSHRLLFTGDTLYLSEGEWAAAVLESSDRGSYIDSLELIRGLDFDVLVPWAATAGEPYVALADPAERTRRIDALLDRLRGAR